MNLHDLVTDEPPYVLDPAGAAALGRRRRARHLALAGAGTAAAVTASFALLSSGGAVAPTSTLQPAASTAPSSAPADRWLPLVRKFVPVEWSVDVIESTDDGWSADVDDGQGAGRLSFSFSPHPGSLQQHPCSDPEFVQGGKCEEVELGDGRRLVTREAQPQGGFRSVVVVIVHRDGGGVDVGNDNATFPRLAPGTVFTSAEDKAEGTRGTVTRPMPLYDAQGLVELAKALDAAR